MQLGFVIDHSRCIGCHACTVACKSENDVPLGDFRTWVKYTERGSFPEVKRSFAVLRCNQCTDAPCVSICPVRALDKREDGIVDIDPARCIGCKSCMQACPYDALYINDSSGTAEKCHFCAHRVEIGLAPACAVVCPTEAIVPGDFHDPESAVSRMRKEFDLDARKLEAGTGPNVFYREVSEAAIDPLQADASGGYLWANRIPGLQRDAERFQATLQEAEERASARATYNVDRPMAWGAKVSAYLFTKSLAAGAFLALAALLFTPGSAIPTTAVRGLSAAALFFVAVTTVLLVADLKRPERFLYVVLKANWGSWLARGSVVLMTFGAIVTTWTLLAPGAGRLRSLTLAPGVICAGLTAAYTGWLFGQAKGRVLWLRRGLWLHLVVQALVAGFGLALLARPWLGIGETTAGRLGLYLVVALAAHALFTVTEPLAAPRGREREFHRTARLLTRGPLALRHWGLGVVVGIVAPLLLVVATDSTPAAALAGGLALFGLWVEEDLLVRAGQALPIS